MGKKDNKTAHETPNYEAMVTVEEVELEIERHKTFLVGKDRTEYQIKESKKEYNAAINEQLRELSQEREHEILVISALEDRKKQILAGAGISVLPMPAMP